MTIERKYLSIKTSGRGFYDVTQPVNEILQSSGAKMGMCNLFIHHTSASVVLCENADPSVKQDLEYFMQKLAPDGDPHYQHSAEGEDDMPAHIRTILTQSSLSIPIEDGSLVLGVWQSVYLWEHRFGAFNRKIILTLYS